MILVGNLRYTEPGMFLRFVIADVTGIAAADIVHDFLTMLQLAEPPAPHKGPFSLEDLKYL